MIAGLLLRSLRHPVDLRPCSDGRLTEYSTSFNPYGGPDDAWSPDDVPELSMRAFHVLDGMLLKHPRELLAITRIDLRKEKNCGRKTLDEIERYARAVGFPLAHPKNKMRIGDRRVLASGDEDLRSVGRRITASTLGLALEANTAQKIRVRLCAARAGHARRVARALAAVKRRPERYGRTR